MTRLGPSLTYPLYFAVIALAVGNGACGAKGGDDDTAGTAGVPAGTGGSGGSGGSGGGSGGSAGTGVAMPTKVWNFDEDVESWKFQYFSSEALPDGSMPPKLTNADIGVDWNSNKGYGDQMGCLMVTIPYTTPKQYVGVGLSVAEGVDMTGKKVTAYIKIDSGVEDATDFANAPAGSKLYAKSGTDYVYAAGDYNSITTPGSWTKMTFDLENPGYLDTNAASPFDPSNIRQLGIQIDDGAEAKNISTGVILIDKVSY
jgi:hypothetical protein